MNTLLLVGIIIGAGFTLGEVAERLNLPRVTGYIIAGVFLNPRVFHFVPAGFMHGVDPIINVALCVLTFEVGGTLALAPLRELGKGIVYIALGEASFAALAVAVGTAITLPFLVHLPGRSFIIAYLPIALMLGALGSPTDPSATLAVIHQYKARGPVSFSIMGVAALDDAFGIISFSMAGIIVTALTAHSVLHASAVLEPLLDIGGAILVGVLAGAAFYFLSRMLHRLPEGFSIVLVLGILTLSYGLASFFDVDELLTTMTVGITVVNIGRERDRIFRLLEDYIEPIVFVLFFTISGMYLDFDILFRFSHLVALFVIFRAVGKLSGAYVGASLARTPTAVRRYTGLGLIPQGGIVIGLALLARQETGPSVMSDILVSVIIGATIIHELIGPLVSKFALYKAGEIPQQLEMPRE